MGGLIPSFTHQSGTEQSNQQRTIPPFLRSLVSILGREFLGQSVNPPNTAISVPMQQAVSNLQGGFGGMAEHLGVGGAQDLGPGPNQAGLQTREQLGLPDRSSYFTFKPTAEQVAQLGAVPAVKSGQQGKKAVKKAKRGKPTPHHPELR